MYTHIDSWSISHYYLDRPWLLNSVCRFRRMITLFVAHHASFEGVSSVALLGLLVQISMLGVVTSHCYAAIAQPATVQQCSNPLLHYTHQALQQAWNAQTGMAADLATKT